MATAIADLTATAVTVPPVPPLSGTKVTVASGAVLPTPPPYFVTIGPADQVLTKTNSEIALVTANVAGALTLTRHQLGTNAREIQAGDLLFSGIYTTTIQELRAEIGALGEEVLPEGSGVQDLDMSKAMTFRMKITGNTEFVLTNVPTAPQIVKLIVEQDAVGKRKWAVKAGVGQTVSWIGEEPKFTEEPKGASLLVIYTDEGGTGILMDGQEGVKGVTVGECTSVGIETPTVGSNTVVGYHAMGSSGVGAVNNVAIGEKPLKALITGSNNVAIGISSMEVLAEGVQNTGVGSNTLEALKEGNKNTAVGARTLAVLTKGSENTAIGYAALVSATTASNTVAIGARAAEALTTAEGATAVGYGALSALKTEGNNTGVGVFAGHALTGGANTAVGAFAMEVATSSAENVAVGRGAMQELTTGSTNVAVGYKALHNNKVGGENVAVGWQAGLENLGSGNIFIGRKAGEKEAGSNKLYIANSNTVTPLLLGGFPNASLQVNATEIGFFKHAVHAQPTALGTTAGFTEAAGTGVKSGSTFTGGLGASAYTVGDIVLALKQVGLLAE